MIRRAKASEMSEQKGVLQWKQRIKAFRSDTMLKVQKNRRQRLLQRISLLIKCKKLENNIQ